MKKILFLVKKTQYLHEPLFTEAAKKLGVELVIKKLDELLIKYSQQNHELYIGEHNILDFDIVFFRTVGPYIEEEALISEFCLSHSIPVIDSVFCHNRPWIDRKSFEYQRLRQNNIPIIDSYFVSKKSFEMIKEKITYPVIAKVTDGSKGEGVYKCHSLDELLDVFESENQSLIIQKFVDNEGDIRVFVIGNTIQGAIKRYRQDESEFRNNVSLGGSAEIYNLSDEEKNLTLAAAQSMQYEIAGVDLIKDMNGKLMVMEVNRAPQFNGFMQATGIDIPLKIIEYLISRCR
ncbi:MAG: alpha-galactosidase [Patescibacteria group bacterium]|nr:MAG: alpha-galactosidase [Patescibacteria group bacterium]